MVRRYLDMYHEIGSKISKGQKLSRKQVEKIETKWNAREKRGRKKRN